MKKMLGIVMALLLVVGIAGAWAEEIQGKVKSVDSKERSIVLEDGTTLWVAEGVSMDTVKEGASVKASYEVRDGKNVATGLEVSD